jgi:sugar lactone lactonase YvrE
VFVTAGAGGLRGATGIAFGPDGNLYVGSSQSHQVLRYDASTGASMGAFVDDPDLRTPFSLIFGPDGHLYVSSGTQHIVRRYDGSTGRFMNVAAADSALKQPIGLGFGQDRMLYVVNSAGGNIMRFDPSSGRGSVFATDSLGYPSDLAFGPDGGLYVTNASKGTVVRFDGKTGAFRAVYTRLPARSAPVGLAFTSDGRLFVGDFGSNRLFLVPRGGGAAVQVATDGLAGPENIAVRPQ